MCGLHRATQEDCNDNHNEVLRMAFSFPMPFARGINWNPSRHRGSSGELGWFCTKSCNSGLNGWPSPEKRPSRNVALVRPHCDHVENQLLIMALTCPRRQPRSKFLFVLIRSLQVVASCQ